MRKTPDKKKRKKEKRRRKKEERHDAFYAVHLRGWFVGLSRERIRCGRVRARVAGGFFFVYQLFVLAC
jgi:hypothetical protein